MTEYRRLTFVANAVAAYTTMTAEEFEALARCEQHAAACDAYVILASNLIAIFTKPGGLKAFIGYRIRDSEEERRLAIVANARDNEAQLLHFIRSHEAAARCKCGTSPQPRFVCATPDDRTAIL